MHLGADGAAGSLVVAVGALLAEADPLLSQQHVHEEELVFMDKEIFPKAGEFIVVFDHDIHIGDECECVLEFGQVVDARFGENLLAHMRPFSLLVVKAHGIGDKIDLVVMLIEEIDSGFQRLGQQRVIAIEEGDVLAMGGIDTCVARAADAAVGFVDDGDVVCLCRKPATDFERAVGRTVVDEDDFNSSAMQRLGLEAIRRECNTVFAVEDRHDDADSFFRILNIRRIHNLPSYASMLSAGYSALKQALEKEAIYDTIGNDASFFTSNLRVVLPPEFFDNNICLHERKTH